MLNVKKKIPNLKNKNQNEDVWQLHEEIKNSIKNLYISDQKKAKTIKEYAEILSKIRNEYALLQKEHNQTNIIKQRLNCKNINIMFKIYPKNHVWIIKNE